MLRLLARTMAIVLGAVSLWLLFRMLDNIQSYAPEPDNPEKHASGAWLLLLLLLATAAAVAMALIGFGNRLWLRVGLLLLVLLVLFAMALLLPML